MSRRIFLPLGVALAVVLSSDARADDVLTPGPRIFAQRYGLYAIKIVPDQPGGTYEGVFFTLEQEGKEKVIWRAKLVSIPNLAMVSDNGKYVITLSTWHQGAHSLVVYGKEGKVIADFKLEELLTVKQIESLPRLSDMPVWLDRDIAKFEDLSYEQDELVIRMKHKDWAKVLRLTLSTGKLVKE